MKLVRYGIYTRYIRISYIIYQEVTYQVSLGRIRSTPGTVDRFFILNRVFTTNTIITLLILIITTLQVRIIRIQVVIINMLLLGSRLLLTPPPDTLVEVDFDAVLSCNLAKELLNLECVPRTGRGTRRFLDRT